MGIDSHRCWARYSVRDLHPLAVFCVTIVRSTQTRNFGAQLVCPGKELATGRPFARVQEAGRIEGCGSCFLWTKGDCLNIGLLLASE